MTLAMSWYAISGRKWFKGPRINVGVTHGTEVLDGQSGDSGSEGKHMDDIKLE